MGKIVIVGGGIAGLVAAEVLRERHSVVLVERGSRFGGLLRSEPGPAGQRVDCGTHVLTETGLDDLDNLLYDSLNEEWRAFQMLRPGTYFAGHFYGKSEFVDARALPGGLRERAEQEILQTKPFDPSRMRNLEDYLVARFGRTVTEHVYGPSIRKRFRCALDQLRADNPFVHGRVILFDEERTRALKKDPFFDDKLAFHSFEEGVGTRHHFYPRNGGIGLWVEGIVRGLSAGGVDLRCGVTVESVQLRGDRIRSVTLVGGEVIECDRLVWTVPPALLLRAMGEKFPGAAPPDMGSVGLLHLAFDRQARVDNHYVTCHDEDMQTFRVTLYPNLRGRATDGICDLTVEMLGPRGRSYEGLENVVSDELRLMKIIPDDARRIGSRLQTLPAGFPALTHELVDSLSKQTSRVRELLPEAVLLGKAGGETFLMNHVLVDVYEQTRELLST
jgi:protoporphyrinogen oxidase